MTNPKTNSKSTNSRFSVSKARRVIKFVSTLYRAIGLELPKFQRRLIARLYGNLNERGYRRYRRVYYSTPRKNAKSTLAAALALYHLFADNEPNPRVFVTSTTLEQCRETVEIILRMISAVPVLDRNTRVIDSQNRKEISRYKDGKKLGYIAALTSRGSKEGKNPSVVIYDELCDWTEVHRPLWNSMTMGSFARIDPPPLFLVTTTAGTDNSTIAREQYEYAKKVMSGQEQDEQFLSFIVEADPSKWDDPAEQIRCNPLVVEGFIPEDSIRSEFLQAQASPAELHKFKNKRLNLWVGSTVGYFDMAKWHQQTSTVPDADLVGLPCIAGLDLSRRDDLTALVLLFDQQDNGTHRYITRSYFWIPEEGIEQRARADGQPYVEWITNGQIYLSEGATVDHHLILDKLKELSATYRIREVSYDEWSADYLSTDLERAGFQIAPHRQGFKSMSAPLKELQTIVLNGQLVHGNHPVLTWNAANLNVKTDDAGNVKPTKRNRASKIDGIVALTMALSNTMRHQQHQPRTATALERILAARESKSERT